MSEVRVFDSPKEVAAATADLFVERANAAIAERGAFNVSLAGGNTPKAAYRLLAQEPRRSALDWQVVRVFFGDERCVEPNDEQSNYRMAQESFLRACAVPAENVFRIRGELEPNEAAMQYADTLRTQLGDPPVFDLALLGMGPDGHTASLFPGTDPLTDDDKLARAVFAPSVGMWRITLTPRVFNASRAVAFGIEGSAKAQAFAAIRNREGDPTRYPAEIIEPHGGDLIFIVDKAAAERLQ